MRAPIYAFPLLLAALAPAQPAVTGLQNNYSYLLPGTPNYALARGGIFVLYGRNLAPAGLLTASFDPQLQRTLGGVSIRVAVAGTTSEAIPYYVSPTQISAILPSATPAGSGTLTVTYNGATSAPFPITVATSAFGLMTLSGNGLGQAVVMDANYALLTHTNPAKEDQTVILWGTGLGPDPNDETRLIASPQNLASVPFELFIGHRPAEVLYRGRSQFPGLDQIVAKIPRGLSGCYVSVYAKTGNIISNFATVSIAPGPACGENFSTAEEVQTLSAQSSVTSGWLYLGKFTSYTPAINVGGVSLPAVTTVTNAANAQFLRYRPFDYTNYGGLSQPSRGNCILSTLPLQNPFTAPIVQVLNPGSITLTGPDNVTRNLVLTANSHVLTGATGTPTPLFIPDSGGTFTFRATGGADVGAFSASLTIPGPFIWTNRSSILDIPRTRELEVTWSGGDPSTFVVVTGFSSDLASLVTTFSCTAPASAGRLTVPRDVLASMIPSPRNASVPLPTGQLHVQHYQMPRRFTAPGVDIANITYYTGETALVNFQ